MKIVFDREEFIIFMIELDKEESKLVGFKYITLQADSESDMFLVALKHNKEAEIGKYDNVVYFERINGAVEHFHETLKELLGVTMIDAVNFRNMF